MNNLIVNRYNKLLFTLAGLVLMAMSVQVRAGTPINFFGSWQYSTNAYTGQVKFKSLNGADSGISNSSTTTTSGTLYLTLWASKDSDPYGSGYIVGRKSMATSYDNGTLAPGEYYYNVAKTTTYNAPPDGTYYMFVYVSEYPYKSTILDIIPFSKQTFYTPLPADDDEGGAMGWLTLGGLAAALFTRRRRLNLL